LPLSKQLAATYKHERDNGIKNVGVILNNNESITDIEMRRLWKSLFYCYWMSDKVMVQQNLAKTIANFIKTCSNEQTSLQYIRGFFICISREWHGIDFLRMDKFLSLVRHVVHVSFDWLSLKIWNSSLCLQFANILRNDIDLLNSDNRGVLFLYV